jgi:hypothetical protein
MWHYWRQSERDPCLVSRVLADFKVPVAALSRAVIGNHLAGASGQAAKRLALRLFLLLAVILVGARSRVSGCRV